MPDYVHRSTRVTLRSISPASLPEPEANYIKDPSNFAEVETWYLPYRVITGDVISLATPAEQATIDADLLTARRDATADELISPQSILRAFAEVVTDEINTLRQQFNTTTAESNQLTTTTLADRTLTQLRNAVRGKLNG